MNKINSEKLNQTPIHYNSFHFQRQKFSSLNFVAKTPSLKVISDEIGFATKDFIAESQIYCSDHKKRQDFVNEMINF